MRKDALSMAFAVLTFGVAAQVHGSTPTELTLAMHVDESSSLDGMEVHRVRPEIGFSRSAILDPLGMSADIVFRVEITSRNAEVELPVQRLVLPTDENGTVDFPAFLVAMPSNSAASLVAHVTAEVGSTVVKVGHTTAILSSIEGEAAFISELEYSRILADHAVGGGELIEPDDGPVPGRPRTSTRYVCGVNTVCPEY